MSSSSSTKRRVSKSEASGCTASKRQNTLRYYFSKTATAQSTKRPSNICPICNEFQAISIVQLEIHVNACLDSVVISDNSKHSSETLSVLNQDITEKLQNNSKEDIDKCETLQAITAVQEVNTQKCAAKSWAKLFSEATFKIRGIWSSKKHDIAPGMAESEQSWFGEPRSTLAIKKRRMLPYYKRLAGTRMVVDAFSFGEIPDCEGYLLSHFHSDHYMGLTANWIHGPIYCSKITARLIKSKLGVASDFIHPLPMDTPCLLPGTDGLKVTLIDANHCPGAVIFLIVTKNNLRYLHTGDFRACPKMCLHPLLKDKPLNIVYLDTTYLDPKYSFPSQDACIASACQVVKCHQNSETMRDEDPKISHWFVQEKKKETGASVDKDQRVRLLVVVGTYSLGKERIFIEIAKSLKSKIFVTDEKRTILDTFEDQELADLLTDVPKEAQVHVIPLGHIQPENLEAYFRSLQPEFTQMIAFRPTGWTFRASADPHKQQQQGSLDSIIRAGPTDLTAAALKPSYDTPLVKIYGIPYSEHSSFRELALFIFSLDIHRIVPTVNVYNEKSRLKMSRLFEAWNKDKMKLRSSVTARTIDYPSVNSW